jgi:hypothetical protein
MPNFPTPVGSSFSAIDALALKDADVSIHFLGSSAVFTGPVNDPWFLAQQPVQNGLYYYDEPAQVEYIAEWHVNAVACAVQRQTCVIKTGQCTNLGPLRNATEAEASSIQLTQRQLAVASRIAKPDMPGLVTNMGSENLLAMDYCYNGICAPVPKNQWMIEFENYFSTTLAALQQNSLGYAVGPLNPIYQPYWAPAIANDSWMCDNQIVIRTDYSSFSLLGIALIIGIGGLIIIADFAFGWVYERRLSDAPAKDWQILSLFQLQRLAWEGIQNETTWKHLEKEIPSMKTPGSFVYFHKLVEGRTAHSKSSTNSSFGSTEKMLRLHEKRSTQFQPQSNLPTLHEKGTPQRTETEALP